VVTHLVEALDVFAEEMTAEEAVEALGFDSTEPEIAATIDLINSSKAMIAAAEAETTEAPVTAPAPKVPSLFAGAVAPAASNDAPTPMPVKKAGGIFNFAKPQADASAQ
jgi:hypothetical protein